MYNVHDMKLNKSKLINSAITVVAVAILSIPLVSILTPRIEQQCTRWSDEGDQAGAETCRATGPWFSIGFDPHDQNNCVYLPLVWSIHGGGEFKPSATNYVRR